MKPMARRDGLVVRDLAGETLVYDRERHQAHCLNSTAAAVLRLCDGGRSPEEIAALLDGSNGAAARRAIVKLTLEQLSGARLLVEADKGDGELDASPCDGGDSSASRRELLRLAALALPAIVSIVAPTPAQAASPACINGSDCTPLNTGVRCDPTDGGNCSIGTPSCCDGGFGAGACTPSGC